MKQEIYDFIKENIHLLEIDYENGLINNRKAYLTNRGYYTIGLNYKRISLHNIIVFLKYREKSIGLETNHINGDRTDNRPINLEMVTPKENTQHAFELGLRKPLKGERHNLAKLTNKDVLEIRSMLKEGKTQREIAEIFNVSPSTISGINTGDKWKDVI